MMGGRIWVEEKTDPGAKFVFTAFFPPSTEEAVRAKTSAVGSAKVVRAVEPGTRILVAEDNPENVVLLRAYLGSLPLSLDFAGNGVEAVQKRQQAAYDLVLMDIQMPIMDGYTATREIRSWERANGQARVPIIALTAHALSGASAESIEAGCDGHVTKPVERNDLVESIAKFTKRPAPGATAHDRIAALRPAFLANRGLDLVKMRDALAAADFASIQAIGHNCKGTGAGYGFPEITTAGSEIEKAARALDKEALETALGQFEQCIAAASGGAWPAGGTLPGAALTAPSSAPAIPVRP
jgi:CheY-like chemotaxis protein